MTAPRQSWLFAFERVRVDVAPRQAIVRGRIIHVIDSRTNLMHVNRHTNKPLRHACAARSGQAARI
jgi:hypothetical protein